MDKLRFYTDLYGILRTPKLLHKVLLTPIKIIVRRIANKRLPKYFNACNPTCNTNIEKDLIVSLTSFPARIEYVYLTIGSLLRQTLLPHKIILWLSLEEFKSKDSLPDSLLRLENEVFEIRMVTGNFCPHNKYFYALQEFPDYMLITVDDDIIYSPFMIEAMVRNHKMFPDAIIANCTRRILYKDGSPLPYLKWDTYVNNYASDNLLQLGYCGVLYPVGSLHGDVTKADIFMQLCPYADDLWLNAMARLNKTPVIQSDFRKTCLPVIIKNDLKLCTENLHGKRNDKQLMQIIDYYDKLLDYNSSL